MDNIPFEPVPSPYAPALGFKSHKAAQVCAYFTQKSDAAIEKLKLIKLVYLAESRFISQYAHPMLYDELFSLPHGPICSSTLNGIDGKIDADIWKQYILLQGNKNVQLTHTIQRDDLDEISDAEIEALEGIWESFGWMNASEIRNYCHKHCPEYVEVPPGRSNPISYSELYRALGEPEADAFEHEIQQYRRAEGLLSAQ